MCFGYDKCEPTLRFMDNSRFIFRSLFRGILWLLSILLIYFLCKYIIPFEFRAWLEPLIDRTWLMYTIFLSSEIVIGIIPPELFFIWAKELNDLQQYILIVASLSLISYIAGVIGFFIGRYLNRTLLYRYFKIKFLRKLDKRLQQFGLYLIIIASLTPLPFSGVAMLVGSVRYPFLKYLSFSLFRFLRFGVYAWVLWKSDSFMVF